MKGSRFKTMLYHFLTVKQYLNSNHLSTRYYYYIHNCIDAKYVAPMNERWFKRIMVMVPKRLKKNKAAIERIHGEIKDNYLLAVKKSTVDFVLDEPEIDADERFLDEDDETPLTIELAGE